jgi:hypothetical protein
MRSANATVQRARANDEGEVPLDRRRVSGPVVRPAEADAPNPRELLARARAVYQDRRHRDRTFGAMATLFRDPAWDMALDLFATELEGRPVSVSSVAHYSCVPMSTALRCVDQMVSRGLVTRTRDDCDRRRSLIALTPAARQMMISYLM